MTPLIYSQLGLDLKAIALLEEAISRTDAEARAHVLLSCIYVRAGKVDLAEAVRKAGMLKFPVDFENEERAMPCQTLLVF